MRFRDRFVNNAILECISRPQDRFNCSLAALTAVINYLYRREPGFGIQTMDDVARDLGLAGRTAPEITRGPGNEQVMTWFTSYVSRKGLTGRSTIAYQKDDVDPWSWKRNRKTLARLKGMIAGRDQILVYHMENHYCLVCGYFETAQKAAEAFADDPELNVWIILADHSWKRAPVRSIRWRKVRQDMIANSGGDDAHCFMLFERG